MSWIWNPKDAEKKEESKILVHGSWYKAPINILRIEFEPKF